MNIPVQFRKLLILGMVAALWSVLPSNAETGIEAIPDTAARTALDRGYLGLYNLDFLGAQKDFSAWQLQHPDDPVGPVSEAAGYLFSEFNRLGVLEAQFFENDQAFNTRSKPSPDAAVRSRFQAALDRSQALARARLTKNGKDQDALFALTLASGLQADYAALIEKRNLASLHYTKEASAWAQQLLAVCNDCSDVLVATGFSKYLVGSMSAPVRWLLKMGGVPGDKQAGIADLQITAQHGRYLAPFARVLLAIAYVRDKDKQRALELLTSLRAQFPANTLFPREITRLQAVR
ncbi:MAG: hypothetical protein JWQ87_4701 [Candidatus Sulfotelmatobacter sp.]|nr:hypothetical protein [Candidatus Sulfotelmatobacter sp.]